MHIDSISSSIFFFTFRDIWVFFYISVGTHQWRRHKYTCPGGRRCGRSWRDRRWRHNRRNDDNAQPGRWLVKEKQRKKCLLIRKQRYSWEINRLYNGRKEILCFCTETLFKHNFFLTSCGQKACDYCRKMINQR